MKRKILVPMFASLMALSMNSVSNADQVEDKKENDKKPKSYNMRKEKRTMKRTKI